MLNTHQEIDDTHSKYTKGRARLTEMKNEGLDHTPEYTSLKRELFHLFRVELPNHLAAQTLQQSQTPLTCKPSTIRSDIVSKSSPDVAEGKEVHCERQPTTRTDEEEEEEEEEDNVTFMGSQEPPYQWLRNIMDNIGNNITALLNAPQTSSA